MRRIIKNIMKILLVVHVLVCVQMCVVLKNEVVYKVSQDRAFGATLGKLHDNLVSF